MAKNDDLLKTKEESLDELEFNSNSVDDSPLTNKQTSQAFSSSSGVIDDVGGISNFNVGTDIIQKQESEVQVTDFVKSSEDLSSVESEVEQLIFNEIAGFENDPLTNEQEQFLLTLSQNDKIELINNVLEANQALEFEQAPLEIFNELTPDPSEGNRGSESSSRRQRVDNNSQSDLVADEIDENIIEEDESQFDTDQQFSDQEASDVFTDDISHSFNEDTKIQIEINYGQQDLDGSEVVRFQVFDVPEGASFSNGENLGNGSWSFDVNDLEELYFSPPEHFSGEINLTLITTNTELSSNDTSKAFSQINFNIEGIADGAIVTTKAVSGDEDSWIGLDIESSLIDNDGSESLELILENFPEGSILNGGEYLGNGRWSISSDDLDSLSILPPENFSGDMNLNFVAITTEQGSLDQEMVSKSFSVHVDSVVDSPVLNVNNIILNEDQIVDINIDSSLIDSDGSETLQVIISDIPDGVTFNNGALNENGDWVLNVNDLNDLTLNLPENSNNDFSLNVTAISTETDTGDSESITKSFDISIKGVADTPIVEVSNAIGKEDQWIQLDIKGELTDLDGSESLSFIVKNVPEGSLFSPQGIKNEDGSYSFTEAQAEVLCIKGPNNSDEDFTLDIYAIVTENDGDQYISEPIELSVELQAVSDGPSLSVEDVQGIEDNLIELNIDSSLIDSDGSEALSITLDGLPDGAILNHGSQNNDGSWNLSIEDLEGLAVIPVENSDEDFTLTITSTATELENGDSNSTTLSFNVDVHSVVDEPEVSISNAIGSEDRWLQLDIKGDVTDLDGSENLSFTIANVPEGVTFSPRGVKNEDGTYSFTEAQAEVLCIRGPHNSDEDMSLEVSAVVTESDGVSKVFDSSTLNIKIDPVADQPILLVENSIGETGVEIPIDITSELTDLDGSETLGVTISNVPETHEFNNGENLGNGVWSFDQSDLDGLTVVANDTSSGEYNYIVQATSVDGSDTNSIIKTVNLDIEYSNPVEGGELSVGDSIGKEDKWTDLEINFDSYDTDSNEETSFFIEGVPIGSKMRGAKNLGDGVWEVRSGNLDNLKIKPPKNSNEDFSLEIVSNTINNDTGESLEQRATLEIDVVGRVDYVKLENNKFSGEEDSKIDLDLDFTFRDSDGSENISKIVLSKVPEGAELSSGEYLGKGSWLIDADDLENLSIQPPENSDRNITMKLKYTVEEDDGATRTFKKNIKINVEGVADNVEVISDIASVDEGEVVDLDFNFSFEDSDGSEKVQSVIIDDLPEGSFLSAGEMNDDGSWTVEASDLNNVKLINSENVSGDFDLSLQIVSSEKYGPKNMNISEDSYSIHIDPVADEANLNVSDSSGKANKFIDLDISSSLNDTDGSESLSIIISDLPEGSRLNAGQELEDGSWELSQSDLEGLQIKTETLKKKILL
jgi:hypothetical protein